jgi:hypothetical protein
MKKNSLRIKFALTISTVLLGCAFLFCDGPTREETLRWKTAADIPVNLTEQHIINDLDVANIGDSATILDLGTHEIPIRNDINQYLHKLTKHEFNYWIKVTNNTAARLTFHGLLFENGDNAENLSASSFYNLLTTGSQTALTSQNRIRLLSQNGLTALSNETVSDSMPGELSAPLCNLMLKSKSMAWRWVLEINNEDMADIPTSGTVDINLRIRVSGVNSFDSLFTM